MKQENQFSNIVLVKHPLISHKLTMLRDKNTDTTSFRSAVIEITRLLSYESLKNLNLKEILIETPLQETIGYVISDKINIYPILRAGQGMVDGVTSLVPNAKIGHIGLYRDEKTLKPIKYLFKTPEIDNNSFNIILDPIIATGGSLMSGINILKEAKANKIIVISILGSKQGIENLAKHYPEVTIYIAAIDEKLNKKGYIEPGLGDAGDRIFGTK